MNNLVYLAGPIMSVPDYKERFLAAAEELQRDSKWIPVYTAWMPEGWPENVYMPVCMALLNECEAICLLPGWENSKGALLEKRYAEYQHKRIFTLAEWERTQAEIRERLNKGGGRREE